MRASRERRAILAEMRPLYRRYDLFLTANTSAAPRLDRHDTLSFWTRPNLTSPFNCTGGPALALLCGFTREGLPLSLQIAGRPFDDARVLRAGDAFERAIGLYKRRPTLVPRREAGRHRSQALGARHFGRRAGGARPRRERRDARRACVSPGTSWRSSLPLRPGRSPWRGGSTAIIRARRRPPPSSTPAATSTDQTRLRRSPSRCAACSMSRPIAPCNRRAPRRPSPDLANGETYAGEKPAIAFTSRNSSRPNLPHSRPLPDCL